MDTVTHTLFGLTLYAAVNKEHCTPSERRALFATALVGSQIPDIDVISSLWDTTGQYQMWHRGLTHSVFLVPLWALLIAWLGKQIWKVSIGRLLTVGIIAVFIHNTSDLFNAWGTGYFEPFSAQRITFGTIPIADPFLWLLMLGGWLFARYRKAIPRYQVFRVVWLLMAIHFAAQSVQGYSIYQHNRSSYDQLALSAGFIPGQFQVIGKKGNVVEISDATVWTEPKLQLSLQSADELDLEELFSKNPKAKTLVEWSPFVVVIQEKGKIGVYDPRFYRNGQSFLFEYIEEEWMQ